MQLKNRIYFNATFARIIYKDMHFQSICSKFMQKLNSFVRYVIKHFLLRIMSTNTKCLCMKVDENLQCEICNKSFSDIKQLLHHFDSNHDNQNFIPSIKHLSNEFLTSLDTQLAHNAIKESDILQCYFCKNNLQRHCRELIK